MQETENSITRVAAVGYFIGIDENLLLKPDTTLLHQVALEAYDDYITLVYTNDPAMKLLRKQTELARNEIRWQSVVVFPAYRCMPQILARPVSLRTLADMYNNWNVGLSVSYPLSSIYKNSHKIKGKQTDGVFAE